MRLPKTIVSLLVCLLLFPATIRAQHYVAVGGVLDSTMMLPKLGHDSAYIVNETMVIAENGTLVVEAGCRIYFKQSASLRVDGGKLLLEGTETDSIRLFCYELSHDWMGIQLKNVHDEDAVRLSHVEIMGALSALNASSCDNVSIRNCTFNNYYAGKGIELADCSNFLIDSCFFYCVSGTGIALTARSDNSENNRISHCVFDQGQINVEVSNANYGFKCHNNVIADNCFQGAATAISFEAVGGLSDKDAKNYILNNVISSDLPEGSGSYSSYGIKAAMDSLVIRNNVFWHNDEAITMLRVCHLMVEQNTFYDNGFVLTNLHPSGSASFVGNTISEATQRVVGFTSGKSRMNGNNFLHCNLETQLFANLSPEDIDMRRNHWGTQSEEAIEAVIYDHNDAPELGQIHYDDWLPQCDTMVPVSPPFMVKKQLVGGSWLISWEANPEADIDHYVLFYGDFNYYKFAHHIDAIQGQSYVLPSQQADNVAVMACDRAYNPEVFASVGQSAYAFAAYYPHAGADSELCAPQEGFEIRDANIPYTYNRFAWRSSGTGVFSDSLNLHPTYYPSEADFDAGEVTLTLRVLSQGTWKTDDMQLALYKELSVFAGEDYYSGLNRPLVLNQAEALHYDSLCWTTTGDGVFEEATALSTVYHLGSADKERRYAQLVLQAWAHCGSATDTIRFDLYEDFALEGMTWSQGSPCADVQVVAAGVYGGNPFVSGFYRTVSDSTGHFRFEGLLPDTYVLYAFPDTVDVKQGCVYYLGDYQWSESNMILVDGPVFDVDLDLPAIEQRVVVGEGAISGVFEYPETDFDAHDFYCEPWFGDDGLNYCDGGLSNVGVLLLNATKQRVMGFALTDATGTFRFNGLPFGTYHVLADVPRYGRGICEQVTLTPEQPMASHLHLFIDGNGRVASRQQSDIMQQNDLQVFPNPVMDEIRMMNLGSLVDYELQVTNLLGEQVGLSQSVKANVLGECVVSVQGLPAGVYFITLKGNRESKVIKFIKY